MRKRIMTFGTLFVLLLSMALGIPPAWAQDPTVVSIYDIQYTTDPGGASPYVGQTVTTQGVVTAFFVESGNRSAFIQDGSGSWSGLMLFEPDAFINIGDLVEVTGQVSEFFGLTEIAYGNATVLSVGNSLPAPQLLDSGQVSPALLDRYLAVDALHFNAAYPAALGADASIPLRASDHDPLEGRFQFR